MNRMNRDLTVVMYHYVRDLASSSYPKIKGLDLHLFKEQIHFFKNNYTFISINELIEAYESNSDLPNNAILLTFDDGYKDHYCDVFPVLHDNKIQGCFYPPAATISDKKVLDVNKIHFLLAAVKNKQIIISTIFNQLDEYRKEYRLKDNDYYFSKLGVANRFDSQEVIFIKRILQVGLVQDLREKILDFLFKKYVTFDEKSFSEELYMSSENIKTMIDSGMHFGSHGNNHYWLSSLSKEEQESEIFKSLNFLSDMGENVGRWTMCYPYGNYNKDTLDLLDKYDCKAAFTTRVKNANLDQDNKFEIPRLDTNDFLKKS